MQVNSQETTLQSRPRCTEVFSNRSLPALAGDARPAVAAELTVLGRRRIIAIQVGRREILYGVDLNEHGYSPRRFPRIHADSL